MVHQKDRFAEKACVFISKSTITNLNMRTGQLQLKKRHNTITSNENF